LRALCAFSLRTPREEVVAALPGFAQFEYCWGSSLGSKRFWRLPAR
jgi:hypothetical protein